MSHCVQPAPNQSRTQAIGWVGKVQSEKGDLTAQLHLSLIFLGLLHVLRTPFSGVSVNKPQDGDGCQEGRRFHAAGGLSHQQQVGTVCRVLVYTVATTT